MVVRDHDTELPKFSQEIWEDMLRVFDERYNYFKNICNVKYVMPIYNHGPQGLLLLSILMLKFCFLRCAERC